MRNIEEIGRKKGTWSLQGWERPGASPGWIVRLYVAGPQLPVQTGTVGEIYIQMEASTPMTWRKGRKRRMREGAVGLVILLLALNSDRTQIVM